MFVAAVTAEVECIQSKRQVQDTHTGLAKLSIQLPVFPCTELRVVFCERPSSIYSHNKNDQLSRNAIIQLNFITISLK